MNFESLKQNKIVFLLVIILMTLWGAVTQYLTYIDSYPTCLCFDNYLASIIINLLIGLVFFMFVQFIKFPTILKNKWIWLGVALILTILTVFFGFEVNTVKRFLAIGSVNIDSGYWIILFYILFLAAKKDNYNSGKALEYFKFSTIFEIAVTLGLLISVSYTHLRRRRWSIS